jgi:D-alanyl-D-alanine carboxypeptidase/D-alanyl-D-alanine-endopeptidase (penicillin-binding protein 4)
MSEGRVTRRWVVSALAAGAALPACANAPTRSPMPPLRPERSATGAIAPAAESLVQAARLGGEVAYAVADAATGTLLEGRLPDRTQPPASVVKAVTALYALETLGPGYRFATRLVATGPVSGGRIEGDLILLGGADPTLDTDAMADLAQALRGRGVQGVSGRFLVHGAALPSIARIDPDQPEHVGYNPAISGLNLNYNRVHFRWRRAGGGHEVVMDAPGNRHNSMVSVATMQVANRQAPLFTRSDAGGGERWTVAAPALGREGSRWLPVRHPELYAGDVLRGLARARGTTLPAPERIAGASPQGTVLAEHASAPLAEVLNDMLRWSTNLTAEAVGLAATQARGGRPTTLAQSAGVMAEWAGSRHGLGTLRLVDHSGLGEASRIAPEQMVRLLSAGGVADRLRGLMRDIPLRDENGRPLPAQPFSVAAKTGTLNFVSGLAGYLTPPAGRELVFAIFAADLGARARIADADRERPPGGREWSGRARRLQQQLIERWGTLHI